MIESFLLPNLILFSLFAAAERDFFSLLCAKGGGSAVSRAGGIVFHRRNQKTILQSNLTVCQLPLHKEAFGGKIFACFFLFCFYLFFRFCPLSLLRRQLSQRASQVGAACAGIEKSFSRNFFLRGQRNAPFSC
jgi:hypothetical protein